MISSRRFRHVVQLSDDVGLWEHARFREPRPEHGYCVDDVARGLVALAREPELSDPLAALLTTYLDFVVSAQAADGRSHNRLSRERTWQDEPTTLDCWGRGLWGLGTVAGRNPLLAGPALAAFERGARQRSSWSRAMAFAALGAVEVLSRYPDHPAARSLLSDAVTVIGRPGDASGWRWPEPRLRYANAALAEVLVAAGALLGRPDVLEDGRLMLTWLLAVETRDDHLSVTGTAGWTNGEPRPAFDQQPIEVSSLADACARALDVTCDPRWRDAVHRCAAWFDGHNDLGIAMDDDISGGGCDGLQIDGRNENQGAESTLALITTRQHAAVLGAVEGVRV